MSVGRINSLLDLLAPEFAKGTALTIPDTGPVLTYRELREQVELQARALSEGGIKPGDVAVLALPNSAEFLITFLALTTCRAVALPVNPAGPEAELKFAISDSGARMVIAHREHQTARQAAHVLGVSFASVLMDVGIRLEIDRQAPPAEPHSAYDDSDDLALILYTSGTTSRPKAVPLTHANLAASMHSFAECFQLSADDSTIVVMPPFHVHGLVGAMLSTLYSGGQVVLPPRFSATAFWADVTNNGVTWYTASPTIHQILLKRAERDSVPHSVLRFIRSSSAKLAPAVLSQVEERFGTIVIEAYGMTEATNQVSANPLPPGTRKIGSVGLSAGTEIVILDENGRGVATGEPGEICIKGPSVMQGYRNNSEARATSFIDGWYRTGDQGYLDSDRYLFVSGRIKELINRGGEKISPVEVESILLEHPHVLDAVCFGVEDEKYGEEIHAAIVPKLEPDVDDLTRFCRERLSDYKIPKVFHFVAELPRNATNKIQRDRVAEWFQT